MPGRLQTKQPPVALQEFSFHRMITSTMTWACTNRSCGPPQAEAAYEIQSGEAQHCQLAGHLSAGYFTDPRHLVVAARLLNGDLSAT